MNPVTITLIISLLAAPVNIQTGQPAPYDGAIVDPPTAEQILIKRKECEEEKRLLEEELKRKPEETPKAFVWGLGVGIVAGFVFGVWVGSKI